MVKRIELTQGKEALVDDDVYIWASKLRWRAKPGKYTWYAAHTAGKRPFRKLVYLHREIMNATHGMQVDHIDGNGLNCTRANLRLATNAQNSRNRGPRSDNTSGFKGVTWDKKSRKWRAQIQVNGRGINLGLSNDPSEAARAYDSAARKYFGNFAKTNFD